MRLAFNLLILVLLLIPAIMGGAIGIVIWVIVAGFTLSSLQKLKS